MIKIENLSYKYKSSDYILKDISLDIYDGEIISIIGKNGEGKSTLAKLIAGLIKPTKGKIYLNDIDIHQKDYFFDVRKNIGIVFQNPDNQIIFPSVYDDLEFALNQLKLDNKEERIISALDKVDMKNYIKNDTYKLSLGQKQRVNIASVLAVEPKYIILDEPTTMIDSSGKEKIYNIIKSLKELGYTIIYITNNIDEILLSDRIVLLKDKNIQSVFNKSDILDNISILGDNDIKIPGIIEIILKLKEKGINLDIKDFTNDEMVNEIVRMCNDERRN